MAAGCFSWDKSKIRKTETAQVADYIISCDLAIVCGGKTATRCGFYKEFDSKMLASGKVSRSAFIFGVKTNRLVIITVKRCHRSNYGKPGLACSQPSLFIYTHPLLSLHLLPPY